MATVTTDAAPATSVQNTHKRSRYAVEAIRTFVLVFTVGAAVASRSALAPLAIGAAVMGMFAWHTLWVYVLAQLLGGIAAGMAFIAVSPDDK